MRPDPEQELERRVQEEIARLVREGRLQPAPDPELERLAREYQVVPQLRRDLALAGVTRAELFDGEGTRRRLRAHDLRATFVTLALAAGRTEQWVTDRTGHTHSEVLARYRRGARLAAELDLGWLAPLREAIPELSTDRLPGVQSGSSGGSKCENKGNSGGASAVTCLEIMCTGNGTEGSNPSLSAENKTTSPTPDLICRRTVDGGICWEGRR